MSDIVAKVRTRGSWAVRVRPVEFIENRVPKSSDLIEAVRKSHVELRGWDFPHFDFNRAPIRKSKYIAQETDWEHYVELWRAYKSGQFFSICSLWGDWRDQSRLWPPHPGWKSGATLGVEDAIFRFVEIFEFAARWSRAIPIGSELFVECKLRGLKDRGLEMSPRRMSMRFSYVCAEDEFVWSNRYSPAQIFAAPRENAISPSIELLELFGWDVSESLIREIQGELRN